MNTCIIVTYNPEKNTLISCLSSIYAQMDRVLIVDNSDCNEFQSIVFSLGNDFENLSVVTLGANYGVAYAQNRGLLEAKGSDYVLVSDQDTIYPADYLADMIDFSLQEGADLLFPTFRNGGNEFFYRRGLLGHHKKPIRGISASFEVSQGISSGSLLGRKLLQSNILMVEELFIDLVDFEWCWRLAANGFKLKQNPYVFIEHKIGDGSSKLFKKEVFIHSPVRHYYIVRNTLYLAVKGCELDFLVRLSLMAKALCYVVLFPILFKPRVKNLRCVFKAYRDFLFNKMGKFNIG